MLSEFKRIFLIALLALTGLSAVIIGGAVLRQGCSAEALGWAVKGAGGCGILFVMWFAGFTALDREGWRGVSVCGMLLAGGMLLALPAYVGWEILDPARGRGGVLGVGGVVVGVSRVGHEHLARLVETGMLTAGLLCLVPFVMIPRMKRVGRIVQYTTVVYSTAAYLAALMVLWDMDSERVHQAVVTMLIPAGVCMMGVFVLHKFFEIRQADPLSGVSDVVQLKCPRCQSDQEVGLGNSRCGVCRLKITIAVEVPKCPNCGFNVHGLTRAVCPECGLHLDVGDLPVAGANGENSQGGMGGAGQVPATQ